MACNRVIGELIRLLTCHRLNSNFIVHGIYVVVLLQRLQCFFSFICFVWVVRRNGLLFKDQSSERASLVKRGINKKEASFSCRVADVVGDSQTKIRPFFFFLVYIYIFVLVLIIIFVNK